MNVGPRADGTIPDEAADLLRGLGAWLQVNGEAIYNTRHWTRFGEGPTDVTAGHLSEHSNADMTAKDIRYTQTDQAFYATLLGWPEGDIQMTALTPEAFEGSRVSEVSLLGGVGHLDWHQSEEGLTVSLPPDEPASGHAFVVKFALGQAG